MRGRGAAPSAGWSLLLHYTTLGKPSMAAAVLMPHRRAVDRTGHSSVRSGTWLVAVGLGGVEAVGTFQSTYGMESAGRRVQRRPPAFKSRGATFRVVMGGRAD